eukprot:TRINITY_DN8480_c0_g1_i2.p1 TRINITY_DN8480_c0_g1~~TRINITY_DN8480_c0_g1_i2.p1  ORF type:complete len:168 (-),score=17.92 TRINITY_DN8480_c0_g1_i2:86-589(-)
MWQVVPFGKIVSGATKDVKYERLKGLKKLLERNRHDCIVVAGAYVARLSDTPCEVNISLAFIDEKEKEIGVVTKSVSKELPLPDPKTGQLFYKCLKVEIYNPNYLKQANSFRVTIWTSLTQPLAKPVKPSVKSKPGKEPPAKSVVKYKAGRIADAFLRIVPREFLYI